MVMMRSQGRTRESRVNSEPAQIQRVDRESSYPVKQTALVGLGLSQLKYLPICVIVEPSIEPFLWAVGAFK